MEKNERRECRFRDERILIDAALDPMTDQMVTPEDIVERFRKQKFLLQCPECMEKVSPVCGAVRAHHFRHFRDGGEREKSGKKNSVGGPSAWHRLWQHKFPKDCREQYRSNSDGEGRRADVILEDRKMVIEIQKADFTGSLRDEARSRTEFWNGLGYKIVWLFCLDDQCGYLGLPDESDKSDFPSMVMYLENFHKLIEKYDRDKIEIHFVDLYGNQGYEFIPVEEDSEDLLMKGVAPESYFLPYAPVYDKELEEIRAELPEKRRELISLPVFYEDMDETARRIADYLKSKESAKKETKTLYDMINGRSLYDLIKQSLQFDVKVLIVCRPDKDGVNMTEYKIFPGDWKYYIEKYKDYPRYTFSINGWYRKHGYKDYIVAPVIYSPELPIWQPLWAVDTHDRKLDVESIFGGKVAH